MTNLELAIDLVGMFHDCGDDVAEIARALTLDESLVVRLIAMYKGEYV